jgi:coenzyme F420-reducing hydrogenase beta subunit
MIEALFEASKIDKKYAKKANKHLRKNLEFITVSIFCKQTKTEEFANYQRSILNAKPNEKIFFRGKGWPGITRVNGRGSLSSTNLKFNLTWPTFAFTPSYCFPCSDPLGISADIAVGDAWLKKYSDDKVGSSLFIANTRLGTKIINEMQEKNLIYANEETKENIIMSQSEAHIKFKTSHPLQRDISFGTERNNKHINTPKQYIILLKWIKINKTFSEFLGRNKIINFVPIIILKIYLKIYSLGFIGLNRKEKK